MMPLMERQWIIRGITQSFMLFNFEMVFNTLIIWLILQKKEVQKGFSYKTL